MNSTCANSDSSLAVASDQQQAQKTTIKAAKHLFTTADKYHVRLRSGFSIFMAFWITVLLIIFQPQKVEAVTQVQSVGVNGMTIAYPGQSFPVTFKLIRYDGTPVTMTVDFYLIRESSSESVYLKSFSYTSTNVSSVQLAVPSPFTGEPDGWRIMGVERNQPSNLAVSKSSSFSIGQSPPNIQFYGVNGTSTGDKLITAKSSTATSDSTTGFTSADTLYFTFELANLGEATQKGAMLRVLWDGVNIYGDIALQNIVGYTTLTLGPGSISNLTPGNHNLNLQIIGGSNYSVSKSYSETISVASVIDLAPYQPTGWSSPIMASSSATTISGGDTFSAGIPLYLNMGFVNRGQLSAGSFQLRLLIDNIEFSSVNYPYLDVSTYDLWEGLLIGTLSPGTHVLKMEIDSLNQIAESNEQNNSSTLTIYVTAPAIAVERPTGTPLTNGQSTVTFGTTTLGKNSDIIVTLRNTGTENLIVPLSGITFTGATAKDFSIPTWSTTTISPGGTVPLTLRYTPTSKGIGTSILRIASNAYGSNSQFSLNLAASAQSRLDAWRQQYYPGSTPTSGSGADNASPLGDGVPNLIKYATAINPLTPGVMPGIFSLSPDGTSLFFEYSANKEAIADGIVYIVEWTDDLTSSSWSSSGVTYQNVEQTTATTKIKASVPKGGSKNRFLRLRIETASNL